MKCVCVCGGGGGSHHWNAPVNVQSHMPGELFKCQEQCACVCVNYVNYSFVHDVTFVFLITVLSVLKYTIKKVLLCTVMWLMFSHVLISLMR